MILKKPSYILLCFILLGACSAPKSSMNSSPAVPIAAEVSFCSTSNVYTSPVIITGTASFYKRGLDVTKVASVVTQMTLGAPISTPLPIRFAEIIVLDSNGSIVQCGKTNSSGALKGLDGILSLEIPNTPGTYTVQVMSRSNHTLSVPMGKTAFNFKTSVKTDIYSNTIYKVTKVITSAGTGSIATTLTAYARESESNEVLGGSFNIYNDLLTAYEYIAQNTGLSDITCLNPKLDVYWKAGFNPAQYLYPSADPNNLNTVSFYVRGDNQLYINGGVLGNVYSKDTDHFDDAVILHELGHHVEDVCGKMDSPGGTHYGFYRIDPRLSWSEGWGNFFGAHMIRNNLASLNPDLAAQLPASGWLHYLDTDGYNDGTVTGGSRLIMLNLTKAGSNPESVSTTQGVRYYDKVDAVNFPGEGHAREVSISRSLFKGTNTCASLCTNANYFANYWQAFENNLTGIGMGKPNYPFRSSTRFYNRLNQVFVNAGSAMPASIDSILNSDEAQQRETNAAYTSAGVKLWPAYGIKLVNNGATACPLKIQAKNEDMSVTNGFSDQRFSNQFYYVDLSVLSNITDINLSATKLAGTTIDIDLILLKEDYQYNSDCTLDSNGQCTTWGKNTSSTDMLRSDRSVAPGTSIIKSIRNLNSLSPSGHYLLDLRAYTANTTILSTTEYSYVLTDQTGAFLCPATTF